MRNLLSTNIDIMWGATHMCIKLSDINGRTPLAVVLFLNELSANMDIVFGAARMQTGSCLIYKDCSHLAVWCVPFLNKDDKFLTCYNVALYIC